MSGVTIATGHVTSGVQCGGGGPDSAVVGAQVAHGLVEVAPQLQQIAAVVVGGVEHMVVSVVYVVEVVVVVADGIDENLVQGADRSGGGGGRGDAARDDDHRAWGLLLAGRFEHSSGVRGGVGGDALRVCFGEMGSLLVVVRGELKLAISSRGERECGEIRQSWDCLKLR